MCGMSCSERAASAARISGWCCGGSIDRRVSGLIAAHPAWSVMDIGVVETGRAGAAWPWAQAELFRGLPETDLESIAARLTLRPFSAGEILIRQGVWTGALFILRAGIVQISLEVDEDGVAIS